MSKEKVLPRKGKTIYLHLQSQSRRNQKISFNNINVSCGLTLAGAGLDCAAWTDGGSGAPIHFFNRLNMVVCCVGSNKQVGPPNSAPVSYRNPLDPILTPEHTEAFFHFLEAVSPSGHSPFPFTSHSPVFARQRRRFFEVS